MKAAPSRTRALAESSAQLAAALAAIAPQPKLVIGSPVRTPTLPHPPSGHALPTQARTVAVEDLLRKARLALGNARGFKCYEAIRTRRLPCMWRLSGTGPSPQIRLKDRRRVCSALQG